MNTTKRSGEAAAAEERLGKKRVPNEENTPDVQTTPKRNRSMGEEAEYPTGKVVSDSGRAERKRQREQQRRHNLNKGLDEMMAILFRIDPRLKDDSIERSNLQSRLGGPMSPTVSKNENNALLSRVEIVQYAVSTLERLHRENEERKMVIADLMAREDPNAGRDRQSLLRGGYGGCQPQMHQPQPQFLQGSHERAGALQGAPAGAADYPHPQWGRMRMGGGQFPPQQSPIQRFPYGGMGDRFLPPEASQLPGPPIHFAGRLGAAPGNPQGQQRPMFRASSAGSMPQHPMGMRREAFDNVDRQTHAPPPSQSDSSFRGAPRG